MARGTPDGRTIRREIQLSNRRGYVEARSARLHSWLERLLEDVAPEGGSLAVRFVGERTMRRFNREFRAKDRPTDVLSFPGDGESITREGGHLGDIVVCVPIARAQARERGHTVKKELRILLLHGVLHCLGYDHETDAGEMDRLERRLRRRWVNRG